MSSDWNFGTLFSRVSWLPQLIHYCRYQFKALLLQLIPPRLLPTPSFFVLSPELDSMNISQQGQCKALSAEGAREIWQQERALLLLGSLAFLAWGVSQQRTASSLAASFLARRHLQRGQETPWRPARATFRAPPPVTFQGVISWSSAQAWGTWVPSPPFPGPPEHLLQEVRRL